MLNLVYFPSLSIGQIPFEFIGCLVMIFFIKFKSTFCKQTVHNMIRRSILWHLIFFCIDCQTAMEWMQGLYGLLTQVVHENLKSIAYICKTLFK